MSKNVYYAIEELLKSQPLLKLLMYEEYNPLSKPNIVNPKSLIPEYIYPGFKIPDVIEKQQSILTVECDNAKLSSNPEFTNMKLVFNIMCHTDLWMIKGSIRPYMIMEEIDDIFGENSHNRLSIGKVHLDRCQKVIYNPKFAGYMLSYNLCDFNR
jgi:hypothetical protein